MYTWKNCRRIGMLLFLCLYFNVSLHAQTNWLLKSTVNGVQCYAAMINCKGNSAVILKFVNTNSSNVKISWKEAFGTDDAKEKSEAFYGIKELTLPPGETAASGCTEIKNIKCLILPEQAIPTRKINITDFEFREISVSRL